MIYNERQCLNLSIPHAPLVTCVKHLTIIIYINISERIDVKLPVI